MKILRHFIVVVLVVLGGQLFPANAQTISFLHFFTGSPTDGDFPVGALVQGSDSNYYGITEFGGASGSGTVFRISASGGDYTIVHSFTNAPDGNIPLSGLLLGTDGNLYGTTSAGGTGVICDGGCGTIYRIDPSGTYTTMYSFVDYHDGGVPYGGLVEGVDSNYYGTTYSGGTNFLGTVFRFSPSGVETSIYVFGGVPDDGAVPHASLVLGTDGNFYGTTYSGGTNQDGTVFQISPSGVYTSLYSFAGVATDGFNPAASLVEGVDGNFYGTTFYGGQGGVGLHDGTLFRISTSGSYTSLYSFAGYPGGALPEANLVRGIDSNFYGTTVSGGGGNGGLGTVYRFTPAGVETTLYTFTGMATNGSGPYAALVQGSDGYFYGTTGGGGPTNAGSIFKIAIAGSGGGGGCTYSVTPTNSAFNAAGGSDTVSVSSSNGCAWTATSNDSFLTVTSGSPGSGNGTVHYDVAANTNTTDRIGTLNVAGQTVTITQAGSSASACTYTLSPASITLTSKGGAKNVSVKVKGTDCPWTAVSNDPFITITVGASGTGSGKVDFTVPGNTNTTALSGTMTIAGETFTVNQDAGGCTYKLSPKDGKIKDTGGTGTVKITPNLTDCEWTAVSNDPFITITAGASGTGKGTITYSLQPNTNSVALTGTITIAGQTYTVTEAAPK